MRRLGGGIRAAVFLLAVPIAGEAQQISADGLVDIGLERTTHDPSWMIGGYGKLDGGGSGRQGPEPIGQALADVRLQIDPSLSGFATFRVGPDQHAPFDIMEAYARYRPVADTNAQLQVKLGAFYPPVSLENEGVGWTSPWTVTPSMINSWVGDELRTIGTEASFEWRHETGALGLTGAVFGWNDPAGALLSDRGWVFDSRPSGLLAEPRRPDFVATRMGLTPPLREQPFQELDHRPGWYAGGSARQDGIGRVNILYYDNRADPSAHAGTDFGWRTRFTSVGAEADIGDVVLLGQAMAGRTEIDPVPNFSSTTNFQSAYLLAGYYFGQFQVAARVDFFATQQHKDPGGSGAGEHGHALTLSASWNPLRWLRFTTELIQVDGYSGQRTAAGLNPRTADTQVQLITRLLF